MKCPRCKTVPEDDNALYCLVCGKKLRRDDAFDGEFEEEFRFDEEIEEEKRLARERERLLKRERLRTTLIVALCSFILVLVFALFLWFLIPKEVPLSPDENDAESEAQELSSETQTVLNARAEALFKAQIAYDLEGLFEFIPPSLQDYARSVAFLPQTESALKLHKISVSTEGKAESEVLAARLSELAAAGVTLDPPTEAYSVSVTAILLDSDALLPVTADYLFANYGGTYYCLNLPELFVPIF